MERYKFLYELSKKALDEELERYKKLDEKASRFLSILSVGIVAYTTLINIGSSKVIPLESAGWPGWVFVGLSIITLIALFSSWLRIFTSMRLTEAHRVEIGDIANSLAADEELITMYWALALSCQDAQLKARELLKNKTRCLQSAYKEIQFSTYSLMASLMTYFFLALKI